MEEQRRRMSCFYLLLLLSIVLDLLLTPTSTSTFSLLWIDRMPRPPRRKAGGVHDLGLQGTRNTDGGNRRSTLTVDLEGW
jgi:hypothetical protein